LEDFKSLDEDVQNTILETLDLKLKQDPQLMEQATRKQVLQLASDAKLFYQ
jgi:hypothetical protein